MAVLLRRSLVPLVLLQLLLEAAPPMSRTVRLPSRPCSAAVAQRAMPRSTSGSRASPACLVSCKLCAACLFVLIAAVCAVLSGRSESKKGSEKPKSASAAAAAADGASAAPAASAGDNKEAKEAKDGKVQIADISFGATDKGKENEVCPV